MVLAALQHIPLELQMTLELYYWEELEVTEIAEVLEIPLGTVKSRMSRGRRLVKEWIESNPKFESNLREKSLEVVEGWTVSE